LHARKRLGGRPEHASTQWILASASESPIDQLVSAERGVRLNGQSWLISDIYLDGAVSEVATRRSEFAAILKTEGIDGLIAALNRKVELLRAAVVKSF
jgi:ABC-type transporter MlaC component